MHVCESFMNQPVCQHSLLQYILVYTIATTSISRSSTSGTTSSTSNNNTIVHNIAQHVPISISFYVVVVVCLR